MTKEYIIIGFSRPRKFKLLAWIIQKIEHSDYSHAYTKTYSDSLERWLIYQASGLEVNFEGKQKFYEKNEAIKEYLFQVDAETKQKFLQKAVDTIGTPYGIKQLIGIGIIRFGKFIGIKLKNPFRDGRATYVCSELVGELVQDLMDITIDDLDSLGPKELQQIIAQRV